MVLASSRTLPGQGWARNAVPESRWLGSGERGAAILRGEIFGQLEYVIATLAQRGQSQGYNVEPIIQVLAEAAFLHQQTQ